MNEDELKTIWQTSNERMETLNLHTIKLNKMNERIKKFEKSIKRRNNLEIIVAIGIIACYGIYVYIKPQPLAKIGAVFTILYCLNVIYQLRKTEAKQPNFDVMRSVKDQLLAYEAYVKEEQKLLSTVLYWYLLPLLPGMILFLIGTGITWLPGLIYFGLFIPFVFVSVYYWNRKAIEHKTKPLLQDIARTLASLEEEK